LRAGANLDDAFAWKEERTLSQALTLLLSAIAPWSTWRTLSKVR
jgi:hypothetical protein